MLIRDRFGAASKPYLTGWRYGHNNRVAYPWPKGVSGPAVVLSGAEIDCSTMSTSIVMRVYPNAAWKQADYDGLQIAARPVLADAPIRAIERVGVGVRVADFQPETWHLVQGWRSLSPFAGHAIIVWDRGNGKLDVLESTSKDNKGPRWRVTTAEKLKAEFPAGILIAKLFPMEG